MGVASWASRHLLPVDHTTGTPSSWVKAPVRYTPGNLILRTLAIEERAHAIFERLTPEATRPRVMDQFVVLTLVGATTWQLFLALVLLLHPTNLRPLRHIKQSPTPVSRVITSTAAHFSPRTFTSHTAGKGSLKVPPKANSSQSFTAPNILGNGNCAQYGSDAAVNTNFCTPDPTKQSEPGGFPCGQQSRATVPR